MKREQLSLTRDWRPYESGDGCLFHIRTILRNGENLALLNIDLNVYNDSKWTLGTEWQIAFDFALEKAIEAFKQAMPAARSLPEPIPAAAEETRG